MRYFVLEGGNWISETVVTSSTIPSLALDSSNTPHVSYTYNEGPMVKYAIRSGATWVTETVEYGVEALLALDSSDIPHVLYWGVGGQGIKYAYRSGGGWQKEAIGLYSGQIAGLISFAPDNSAALHIAYNASEDDSLAHGVRQDAVWVTKTVEVSATTPSLVIDDLDRPHLAYTHRGPYVKYAVFDGSGWQIEMVDFPDVAEPSLALDSFGNPHVAYYDVRPYGNLKYAYRTTHGWEIETLDVECSSPVLALDVDDNPHILCYQDATDELKYVHWAMPQATESIDGDGGSLISGADQTTYTFPQGTFTDTVGVTHTPRFTGSMPSTGDLTGIGQVFEVNAVFSDTADPARSRTDLYADSGILRQ